MLNKLHVELDNGRLTIAAADGTPLLLSCWAGIEQSDGVRFATSWPEGSVEQAGSSILVRCRGDRRSPELRWCIQPDADRYGVRLWLEVENTTDRHLAVERIDVLVAPGGLLQTPAAALEMAQTGWQSWSPATPPLPLAHQLRYAPPPVIGPMLPPTEADRALSPWMTVLREPAGHSLLVGFISASDQQSAVAVQPALQGHRLAASSYIEGLPLAPGAMLRSETLLICAGDSEYELLERYAQALAATMGARRWSHIPTGWCSWYYFFTDVSESDILRNLDFFASAGRRLPVEYVQIDDGYQQAIGDWLTLNEKFPSGMRALTDAIRAHGFKPGLWFAPFLVSERSQIYADHPDWVLRDHNGEPINASWNWNTINYALDITHPEAADWLRHVVRTMVDDWGYDYLKIDFIYAGALRGRRYDPRLTSVQAYRRGLQIIREEAGERFILGCGAPFAPSVGLVDGMRIGPDVAPYWRHPHDQLGSEPALSSAARSTFAHSWMHPHLWVNDPDCVLLRQHASELTLAEVQAWASLVALSGGMVLLSDDMSRLEPDRLDLAQLLLPPLGAAATPLGPYEDAMPTRMRLAVERPWESWLIAALFNWSDQPRAEVFDPATWSWPDDTAYHLFEFWSGKHSGPHTGAAALPEVPAHGVRLLQIHPDLGRPQMVGSTLHLLGGAVEIAEERWTGTMLELTLRCPGEHTGLLVIYIPPAYEYLQASGATNLTRHGPLLFVSLHLVDEGMLSVQVAPKGT
ncbi:MAG: hypothetical protein KatS3mg057_0342 [Herpetosiphonaceae bacterium]|nr:MAG: hypothetical protein KatS3mg057_0342 [Herpetosiphonaceae bacterium]